MDVPMQGSMQKDWLIWMVVGGAGGVSVLAMLGVFANIIRYESQLHALRNRVSGLQYEYALRLARLQGQIDDDEEGGFDILDEPDLSDVPATGTAVEELPRAAA